MVLLLITFCRWSACKQYIWLETKEMIRWAFWEECDIFLCCSIQGYSQNWCFILEWKTVLFLQESMEPITSQGAVDRSQQRQYKVCWKGGKIYEIPCGRSPHKSYCCCFCHLCILLLSINSIYYAICSLQEASLVSPVVENLCLF